MWLTLRREAGEPHRDQEKWRHLVPAPVLDAAIALGIAALGLASGLGARAQGEHVPAAAIPVLTAMGLCLFPRRRFPATVLIAVAALVLALVLLRTSLEGAFAAVLCAGYSAAVYGSRRLALGLVAAALAALLGFGLPQALGAHWALPAAAPGSHDPRGRRGGPDRPGGQEPARRPYRARDGARRAGQISR